MIKYTCTKVLFRIIHGRKQLNIPNIVTVTSLRWQKNDYLDGLFTIIFDEEETMRRINEWFFHIWDFNKEHIIQPYNATISNILEEELFITCMTPTGFINGGDQSRCYVYSSFQVHFSISFSDS